MDWLVLKSANLLAALLDFGLKSTAFILIAWGGVLCLKKSSASVRCFIWCVALAGLFVISVSPFFAKRAEQRHPFVLGCDDLVITRGAIAEEYAGHLLAIAHLF